MQERNGRGSPWAWRPRSWTALRREALSRQARRGRPRVWRTGGFGGREWGGRFRGRVFDSGDLRFVILRLIAEKPSYGYEIIKEIEERLGGSYAPSPGVVYPTLTLLEELGYVTVSVGDGTKKLHTITAEGTAALEANKAADRCALRADAAGRRGLWQRACAADHAGGRKFPHGAAAEDLAGFVERGADPEDRRSHRREPRSRSSRARFYWAWLAR